MLWEPGPGATNWNTEAPPELKDGLAVNVTSPAGEPSTVTVGGVPEAGQPSAAMRISSLGWEVPMVMFVDGPLVDWSTVIPAAKAGALPTAIAMSSAKILTESKRQRLLIPILLVIEFLSLSVLRRNGHF